MQYTSYQPSWSRCDRFKSYPNTKKKKKKKKDTLSCLLNTYSNVN